MSTRSADADSGCGTPAPGVRARWVFEALPTEGNGLLIFTVVSFSRRVIFWSYLRQRRQKPEVKSCLPQ
jgi:hypothetical protein